MLSNHAYQAANYDYKLYCLMTLKKAVESGLITNEQYGDKQKEFLKAVKFVLEDGAPDKVYEQPEYDPSKDAMAMYASGERYQAFEPSSEECYVDQSEDYEDEMAMRSNDGALVKYRTFSEFMRVDFMRYGALTELGGTASLTRIYQYVFAHQNDIDSKFAYRFNKKGDYKSNVRSTLHNTGAFAQLANGDWTVSSTLKGRR